MNDEGLQQRLAEIYWTSRGRHSVGFGWSSDGLCSRDWGNRVTGRFNAKVSATSSSSSAGSVLVGALGEDLAGEPSRLAQTMAQTTSNDECAQGGQIKPPGAAGECEPALGSK